MPALKILFRGENYYFEIFLKTLVVNYIEKNFA